MKPSEVRERSTEELTSLVQDLRRQLWTAQFKNHTNQLDDTSKIQHLRHDIARVKTVLRQRKKDPKARARKKTE